MQSPELNPDEMELLHEAIGHLEEHGANETKELAFVAALARAASAVARVARPVVRVARAATPYVEDATEIAAAVGAAEVKRRDELGLESLATLSAKVAHAKTLKELKAIRDSLS